MALAHEGLQAAQIAPHIKDLLARPVSGNVRFSDVYAELAGPHEDGWWRKTDFDAELTDEIESTGFPRAKQIPLGYRPWLANYGLVLLDDLVHAQHERASSYDEDKLGHSDIKREIEESQGAVLALANFAPRDDKNTGEGQNGSDFYLALTESGLEVYATPLKFLDGLDARNRILALYRIPNEGHPEFSGEHEQFRSARIVRTRRHPEHLDPIFEYNSVEELIAARQSGEHPTIIPADSRNGHIAYVDKFGNVKLELPSDDVDTVQQLEHGTKAALAIRTGGQLREIPIYKAEDLRSAPADELAVYANCSDHLGESATKGLVELIVRVNGNPSTSENTAIYQLLRKNRDLRIEYSEVSLKA